MMKYFLNRYGYVVGVGVAPHVAKRGIHVDFSVCAIFRQEVRDEWKPIVVDGFCRVDFDDFGHFEPVFGHDSVGVFDPSGTSHS